jgi:hypothetical protein
VRGPAKASLGSVLLLLALTLAGCGSANKRAVKATIPFGSPALVGSTLPARYTCAGEDVSPPVIWGAVPAGIRTLALFIIGIDPSARSGGYTISVEWAVAGINAALHKIPTGQLPPGAYLGRSTRSVPRRAPRSAMSSPCMASRARLGSEQSSKASNSFTISPAPTLPTNRTRAGPSSRASRARPKRARNTSANRLVCGKRRSSVSAT